MARKTKETSSALKDCLKRVEKASKEVEESGLRHLTEFVNDSSKSLKKHFKTVKVEDIIDEVVSDAKKELNKLKKEMKK
jgi:hypothetical protein